MGVAPLHGGKFVQHLLLAQEAYLLTADTRLTVGSWAKGLVEELMSLTHSQWIYRNVSKHHTTRGLSQQETERHLDAEIERHRSIGFGSLPAETHYLQEMPYEEVEALTRLGKQYWLLAVEAARM